MKEVTSTKPYTVTGPNQVNPIQNSLSTRFLIEHDLTATLALLDKYIHQEKMPLDSCRIEDFLWQLRCHVETAHCRYRYMMDNAERTFEDF